MESRAGSCVFAGAILLSGWVLRDCHGPLGPRNDKLGSLAPLNLYRKQRQPAWRSVSAATDAIGLYVLTTAAPPDERRCALSLLISASGSA